MSHICMGRQVWAAEARGQERCLAVKVRLPNGGTPTFAANRLGVRAPALCEGWTCAIPLDPAVRPPAALRPKAKFPVRSTLGQCRPIEPVRHSWAECLLWAEFPRPVAVPEQPQSALTPCLRASPKRRAISRGRAKSKPPRRHSYSEGSRFFLRSCATRTATQERRQAIDLTAFFMVAGERSQCDYGTLSSYLVISSLTPAAASA